MLAFLTLQTRCILGRCSGNVLCYFPVLQEVLLFFLRNNSRYFFVFHSPSIFLQKNLFSPPELCLNFSFASYFWAKASVSSQGSLVILSLPLILFILENACLCHKSPVFSVYVFVACTPFLSTYGFQLSQNSVRIHSFAPGFVFCSALLEAILSLRNSY